MSAVTHGLIPILGRQRLGDTIMIGQRIFHKRTHATEWMTHAIELRITGSAGRFQKVEFTRRLQREMRTGEILLFILA